MSIDLSGVFAPITTPFRDEKLDLDRLRENLRAYKQTTLAGFFALGSNGESKSLDEKEKLNVLEVVVAEKGTDQRVMAGGGCESTLRTIAFCRQLAGAGADLVSVLTPSYFKKAMTDDALIGFYTDVADALLVPVVVYNAPGYTGLEISPHALETISRHPNIIGMKDSSPFHFGRYLEVCDKNFQLLSGSVSALFSAVTLGAVGGVASLANAFPRTCCRFFEKIVAGDLDGARQLHFTLSRLNTRISGRFGMAGMKYAIDLAGLYGGLPRRPLRPLDENAKKIIEAAITSSGVLEMEQNLPVGV
jgi:4-hydroxy-2-oxoglutarate aldolase